jgi:hypothetical protein
MRCSPVFLPGHSPERQHRLLYLHPTEVDSKSLPELASQMLAPSKTAPTVLCLLRNVPRWGPSLDCSAVTLPLKKFATAILGHNGMSRTRVVLVAVTVENVAVLHGLASHTLLYRLFRA